MSVSKKSQPGRLLGATDPTTYANNFTFCGLPLDRSLDTADAFVLGVPYDLATSARAGARFGPTAIRQASKFLRWEKQRWPWRFALADRLQVADYGDVGGEPGQSQQMSDEVAVHAARIAAAGKFLVTLGGDHFVSLPLLRGIAPHCGPIALVHFDAHTDTEQSDLPFYHGSMFAVAMQEQLFDPQRSIQLGIRTEYEMNNYPMTVLDGAWMNNHSAESAIEHILSTTDGLPIYLSIDIDFLDPAFAPGTGTPVVGGGTTDLLLQILRGLSSKRVVAADVMEVAPAYDHAEITALAGASIALELLYLRAASC